MTPHCEVVHASKFVNTYLFLSKIIQYMNHIFASNDLTVNGCSGLNISLYQKIGLSGVRVFEA